MKLLFSLETGMGMSEVVMLDMMGHMVVLGTALDTGVCRWAKFSHLQHTVYETGSQAGNICSWSGEKYS